MSPAIGSIVIQTALGQSFWSYGITIAGLIVVATSVIGCALLRQILSYFDVMDYAKIQKSTELIPRRESVFAILAETTPLIVNGEVVGVQNANGTASSETRMKATTKAMLMGFLWSSLGGLCYCAVPLPSLYVGAESVGIKFSLSFGVGCLVVLPLSILNVIALNALRSEDGVSMKQISYELATLQDNLWHFKEACAPGLGAGIVWGIGNLMGIVTFQYLNYVIVMVYVQLHIPVALLWGICLWKEITQTIEIVSLFVLTSMLIGGMVTTTYGVYGAIF